MSGCTVSSSSVTAPVHCLSRGGPVPGAGRGHGEHHLCFPSWQADCPGGAPPHRPREILSHVNRPRPLHPRIGAALGTAERAVAHVTGKPVPLCAASLKTGSDWRLPADSPAEHRPTLHATSAQPYGRKAPSEAVGGTSAAKAPLGSTLCTPP